MNVKNYVIVVVHMTLTIDSQSFSSLSCSTADGKNLGSIFHNAGGWTVDNAGKTFASFDEAMENFRAMGAVKFHAYASFYFQ